MCQGNCNGNCSCCKKVVITERGERGPQGVQGIQGPQGEPGQTCNVQVGIAPTENPLEFVAVVPLGVTVSSYEWSIVASGDISYTISGSSTSATVTLSDNISMSVGLGLLRLRVTLSTGCVSSDYHMVFNQRL